MVAGYLNAISGAVIPYLHLAATKTASCPLDIYGSDTSVYKLPDYVIRVDSGFLQDSVFVVEHFAKLLHIHLGQINNRIHVICCFLVG